MVTGGRMREIMLHGGADEAFDPTALVAKHQAELYGERLKIIRGRHHRRGRQTKQERRNAYVRPMR